MDKLEALATLGTGHKTMTTKTKN